LKNENDKVQNATLFPLAFRVSPFAPLDLHSAFVNRSL